MVIAGLGEGSRRRGIQPGVVSSPVTVAPKLLRESCIDGRRELLRKRYRGLKVAETTDPSNALMQEFDRQHDADQLQHVPWVNCTKRGPELLSEAARTRPGNKHFVEDARGYLTRVPAPAEATCEVGGGGLLLQDVWGRAGAAGPAGQEKGRG